MTTRRRWVWLGALVVVVVIGAAAAVLMVRHTGSHPNTDCQVAREMIAYNKSQGKAFTDAFNPSQDREATVADYRKWADQMRSYSAQIHDPELSSYANQLAGEADQLVGLVQQARSDTSVPADPEAPPPWTQPYADLSKQFHGNLVALDHACPAK